MSERSNERGGGRLAGALARKSGRAVAGSATGTGDLAPVRAASRPGVAGGGVRSRRRTSGPSRTRSADYKQCMAHIRKDVRERVEEARHNREVRAVLEEDLRAAGILFKPGNPEYSALVELLLVQWLENVGFGPED
ncbi:Hypothetical Protein RradSPS_2924 (plasmid) [Rubrobacter radiotolerans]|uniref:Uncharacterized protein n=1 Tax=Rubrobacter radiotolerans TaxID=42256 RepID=A0A023X6Y3_RUBRA|nr:hypothetical protein [Rubrobacter radiotolerans]AHY48207.1 Hypothetical Protein RradSPS_2924 [Rubrobacter radiotolerans]MDX5895244.1 hypothetical protein [Rubrobacter radiotolerans]SMC01869.1 hypothetical protein SAMN00767673_3021 [Rubrobacter radiotolerans DSM 5868]